MARSLVSKKLTRIRYDTQNLITYFIFQRDYVARAELNCQNAGSFLFFFPLKRHWIQIPVMPVFANAQVGIYYVPP